MMQCNTEQSFILPWPPSVNSYWRHPTKGPLAGRHLISVEGRAYRVAVKHALDEQRFDAMGADRLAVDIVVEVPDRRRRDLDNITKGLLDALCEAGLYADDSQIDDLHIIRGQVHAPGYIRLTIRSIGNVESKLAA